MPSADRLGTPGLALMILGMFIMYWGFGIFRGETRGSSYPRKPITVPGVDSENLDITDPNFDIPFDPRGVS